MPKIEAKVHPNCRCYLNKMRRKYYRQDRLSFGGKKANTRSDKGSAWAMDHAHPTCSCAHRFQPRENRAMMSNLTVHVQA